MGGRTFPTECEHGNIVDYGDFGTEPPGDDANETTWEAWRAEQYPTCPQCAAAADSRFSVTIEVDLEALRAAPEIMSDIYSQQMAETVRRQMLERVRPPK